MVYLSYKEQGEYVPCGKRLRGLSMRLYDISVPIYNGMPVFPGDPAPDIKKELTLPADPFNVSIMYLGTHTGTHIDPPIHFIENGYTVDRIPLDHLYGKCDVVDLTYVRDAITADDLKKSLHDEKILLFKTRNSELWKDPAFRKDYVYLDESAGKWIVENGIKTVGIDYLSVGSFDSGEELHRILLRGEVTAIEGLNLTGIEPGKYTLACLPLKIKDGDGAPARAILIRD
jgi:arylformamidase